MHFFKRARKSNKSDLALANETDFSVAINALLLSIAEGGSAD